MVEVQTADTILTSLATSFSCAINVQYQECVTIVCVWCSTAVVQLETAE